MSRDYAICPKCGTMLPEWMDGTWTCDCGETTIEVDLRVDCSSCGVSVKEYDARPTSYACHHPSGGSLSTYLQFCDKCDPGLYQVLVMERGGCGLPGYAEDEDRFRYTEDIVAGWLSALPHGPRACGCGEREHVGGLVLPAAEGIEGDEPLDGGEWVLRAACIPCVLRFKKENGQGR